MRAFLAANWPVKGTGRQALADAVRRFRRLATEQGYLYRGVPRRYGGSEQAPDPLRAEIVRQEFAGVRAPMEMLGAGPGMLVPTLLEWGAEWQKERFIRKTLDGELVWAQGYSEPGAGSDLASLRTRAALVDGEWIINGQKIWSSYAYRAQYMFALVRTEPEAPKHRGISYLLIDLHQPGIEIRRIRQMTGKSKFCEVFFNDARTPADWIVGERGRGWEVTRTTLTHERSSTRGIQVLENRLRAAIRLAQKTARNGRPAIEDPDIRRRLVAIQGSLMSLTYSTYRQMSMDAAGQDPGHFRLLMKLYGSNLAQDLARLSADILGADFLELDTDDSDAQRGDVEKTTHFFMSSLVLSIAGGSSNIQRNIIAERALGLPKSTS